jgi:hypothetical protein
MRLQNLAKKSASAREQEWQLDVSIVTFLPQNRTIRFSIGYALPFSKRDGSLL